jgi:hypothetical protein
VGVEFRAAVTANETAPESSGLWGGAVAGRSQACLIGPVFSKELAGELLDVVELAGAAFAFLLRLEGDAGVLGAVGRALC